MKRMITLLCVLAIVSQGCDSFHFRTGMVNGPSSQQGGDNPSGGNDPSGGNPGPGEAPSLSGLVKTVTKDYYMVGTSAKEYKSMQEVTTVEYGTDGRVSLETTVNRSYDENGVESSEGALTSRQYHYYLPGGKYERRNHPEEETAYLKAEIDEDGLFSEAVSGYFRSGQWTTNATTAYAYGTIPGLSGWYILAEDSEGNHAYPWEFEWDSKGNLTRAREHNPKAADDPDEDGTLAYFYTSDANPTLGKAYDISGLLLERIDPYGLKGRGSANLPLYANTYFRNRKMDFSYEWNRDKTVLSRVEVIIRPFADDPEMKTVVRRHVYTFTYYE